MNKITLNPYLFFSGNCREAMEFYKNIFGGELTVKSFDDMPGNVPENMKGKVMHASLMGGDADLMASDSDKANPVARKIELSLSGTDEVKLGKIFDGLSMDGTVKHPLKKEFWGDIFGGLTDKYGIEWMVSITAKKE